MSREFHEFGGQGPGPRQGIAQRAQFEIFDGLISLGRQHSPREHCPTDIGHRPQSLVKFLAQ